MGAEFGVFLKISFVDNSSEGSIYWLAPNRVGAVIVFLFVSIFVFVFVFVLVFVYICICILTNIIAEKAAFVG